MSAETVFADLVSELAEDGATPMHMFGTRALGVDGKIFAVLQGDHIALRLGAGSPEHAEAVVMPGAGIWHPPGRPKPYEDWVSVLVEENSELEETEFGVLARAALRQLAELPA